MADIDKMSGPRAHGMHCPYCRSELEVRQVGIQRFLGSSEFKKSERVYLCPVCDVAEDRNRHPKVNGPTIHHSRLCLLCEVHWPTHDLFKECPTCREPTISAHVQPDITLAAALIERNSAEFGWWLWEHGFPTEEEVERMIRERNG